MVSLSESPANWWKEENSEESCDKSKSESQQRLLPCELIQLSPSVAKSKGYEGTFHQITRHRRGSMQSEAFSEPVFQKQGKLVTFFRGFVLPRTLIGKSRRKKVFQVDLAEHLFSVGIYVPQVVSVCCNFIEARGIVDGVYRLSGISSNIQRLKKSFDDDKIPDLAKDRGVLQDIHSVSSLVKLYFRELPNPVCTFHLYDEFVSAVRSPEEVRILKLREVIAQLPEANYNTLEWLLKHLHRVSLRHKETGMTAKNLAIVWAPNLLRSHALEAGGVEALQGVAVQAVVTEYLIKYCHLVFTSSSQTNTPRTAGRLSVQAPNSFPISSPIKLLSLAEAQEQYQNMAHKRNHILPLHSLTLNTRRKAKHWSKKTFFSKKQTDIMEDPPSLCPCFSEQSQASPVEADTQSESRGLARRTESEAGDPEQSPVILRCLRRGVSEDPSASGFVNKRSSLRDKFRKFALSPISSSHNIIEKFDEARHSFGAVSSLAGQHVNQRILHLNESLEFIDASSDEETDGEMSPTVKRSKITSNRVADTCDQRVKATNVANHVIAVSIKESKSEKSDTNHESEEDRTASVTEDCSAPGDKVTCQQITSNQMTEHLKSFPVSANNDNTKTQVQNTLKKVKSEHDELPCTKNDLTSGSEHARTDPGH